MIAAYVVNDARKVADIELKKAQTTQSLFLAELARQQNAEGNAGSAILLALAALPDTGIARPYVPEAELQLDGASRNLRERIVLEGHEREVLSAAFSPDGKRIVTASSDKTARLWDGETGKPIGEPLLAMRMLCGARRSAPTASASSPRLVTTRRGCGTAKPASRSVSRSRAMRVCVERGVQPRRQAHRHRVLRQDGAAVGRAKPASRSVSRSRAMTDAVWSAAFSPDGKRIVTASRDHTARLWKVFADTQQLVTHAKAIVPRCWTGAELASFFLPPEPPAWCIEMAKWPYHTAAWKHWLRETRAGKTPPLPAAP